MTSVFGLKIKRILFIFTVLAFSKSAMAQYRSLDQYRFEAGITGGSSFYIGDANYVQPFYRTGLAMGGLVRYNLSPRYALKGELTMAEVSGDTRDSKNNYPQNKYVSFHRQFWDISASMEFNFMDYGLPPYAHGYNWFSPYIFLGAGLTSFKDDYDNARMEFNIPWGIGVKIKFAERFNFGVQWAMTSLFADNFDSEKLDNPYGFKNISNTKNNDKYSIAKAFLSIDLFKRKHCKY